MITVKIVVNNECKQDAVNTLFIATAHADEHDGEDMKVVYKNVDSKHFYTARDAKKIINDYAVTKLPFVLLVDDELPEDKQEYAAVYSEEGPITIDRINAKL